MGILVRQIDATARDDEVAAMGFDSRLRPRAQRRASAVVIERKNRRTPPV